MAYGKSESLPWLTYMARVGQISAAFRMSSSDSAAGSMTAAFIASSSRNALGATATHWPEPMHSDRSMAIWIGSGVMISSPPSVQ